MTLSLEKPAYGAPCNGCGVCCRAAVCAFGMPVLRPGRSDNAGPCPALEQEGGRAVCGLVRSPQRYAPPASANVSSALLSRAAARIIDSRLGCDRPDEGQPRDPKFFAYLGAVRRKQKKAIEAALRLWGIRARVRD
jgi:hypothetical protein